MAIDAKKYSILSVDANPDYLFLAPLTCAFWKKLGYQPYVVLVDDSDISPDMLNLVLKSTNQAGGHINHFKHINGYRTCNVAQISRLYASADPLFKDDDYLMTDDVDKLPISSAWFNQQDLNKDIHIFDPDELNYTRLKIGNIGMKAKVWKEVIGIGEGSLKENLNDCLAEMLSKESTWDQGWNLDEYILTKKVFESSYYPDKCQMCVRGANQYGLRNGRIDRTAWKQTFYQYVSSRIIDVHLHRKPYEEEIWRDTKTIMSLVFSREEVDFFEEYKRKFVELTGV